VPGARALDVGCGSGYLTAAMGRMVTPQGRVHGIDIVPALVKLTRENMMKADRDLLDKGVVTLEHKTGWEGAKEHVSIFVYFSSLYSLSPITHTHTHILHYHYHETSLALTHTHTHTRTHPQGPYDAIHVGAAAASVPRSLVEQLKVRT
jgi:protein-L-isoaspartate O-methyltransferase